MFCAKCGKEMEDNAKFCPSCGAEASGETMSEQPAAEQPAAEQPAAASNPRNRAACSYNRAACGRSDRLGAVNGRSHRGVGLRYNRDDFLLDSFCKYHWVDIGNRCNGFRQQGKENVAGR